MKKEKKRRNAIIPKTIENDQKESKTESLKISNKKQKVSKNQKVEMTV